MADSNGNPPSPLATPVRGGWQEREFTKYPAPATNPKYWGDMGGISHYMGRIFLSIEIFFRTLPSDIVYPLAFCLALLPSWTGLMMDKVLKVVNDENILVLWRCGGCGYQCYVRPWEYQNIGTPVCDGCDEDMEYVQTEMIEYERDLINRAAPELLGALRQLLECFEGYPSGQYYGNEVIARCRDAIARAEGRGK